MDSYLFRTAELLLLLSDLAVLHRRFIALSMLSIGESTPHASSYLTFLILMNDVLVFNLV